MNRAPAAPGGAVRLREAVSFLTKMLPDERLGLACLSYQRALASARRGSSPASWRALLTAARNVSAARSDVLKLRRRPEDPPAEARRSGSVADLSLAAARARIRELWFEINREWERSKALIARARELTIAADALLRPPPGP